MLLGTVPFCSPYPRTYSSGQPDVVFFRRIEIDPLDGRKVYDWSHVIVLIVVIVFVCRKIKKKPNILIKTFRQVTKDQLIIAFEWRVSWILFACTNPRHYWSCMWMKALDLKETGLAVSSLLMAAVPGISPSWVLVSLCPCFLPVAVIPAATVHDVSKLNISQRLHCNHSSLWEIDLPHMKVKPQHINVSLCSSRPSWLSVGSTFGNIRADRRAKSSRPSQRYAPWPLLW